MLACVQRVSSASVKVADEVVSEIGAGLLVLLGVGQGDGEKQAKWLADKLVGLRIFNDDAGLMNRSVQDIGGEMLIVSQFTLHGDCRKGRRPSFIKAAPPEIAEPLYEQFIELVKSHGVNVGAGVFGGDMKVALINDGPVTLWLNTES